MVKGIGIDTTDINEVDRLLKIRGDAFLDKVFTKKEIEASLKVPNQTEFLATRFAAKEAVFKAVAHLTKSKSFDFRIVETLNEADGRPYVNMEGELKKILIDAGVNNILISLTTECNFATAFVIAQVID
ncbi:holo-ACP synthase [Clostridium sp. SYSU_GA19001]|uniref:holo-ACP synthase n=1 Tax=Clostridium caldaquaticum TaxID=2940653 RepID=UPI00207704AC|nr:holo-ACP synthase [Clostridium caldaquaticum]MCM8712115.1 holo-ACP synthase [Clostridium caldaquaticum]